MFFLGEIEHRFGTDDSFSRFYRIVAQSKDSAWRILDGVAAKDSIAPYPEANHPLKGSYVGDSGHLVIVDAIVELDAQAFHSKALERFPAMTEGSAEPPEDFPEYVKEIARRMGRSLTMRDVDVAQSVLLHSISASIGETDWQKLRTKFKGHRDGSVLVAPVVQGNAADGRRKSASVYVACYECTECGHKGINDWHDTDAACGYSCGWSGPSPKEDKCPGCNNRNVMGLACPKCSGLYQLVAEADVSAPKQQSKAGCESERECEYCGGSGDVHSIDGEWRGECICKGAESKAVAFVEGRELAVVDENDDDIVFEDLGTYLKRGDLRYRRPAVSRVEGILADARILERARHHAIDHEYWSPERCIAFAQDVAASSGKITKKMQDEIERLYVMAEGAYGLGGERHMQVTLADIAERLLNLQDAMSKVPSEPRIDDTPQVAEDFFVVGKRLAAKVTPDAHTLVLADKAVTQGNSGYLAGFVSTHTRRPTFLFRVRSDGELGGSGRTVPGFNLKDALERVQTRHPEIFIKLGGHEAAMGCTLKAGTLDVFAKAFEAVAGDMSRETR